MRLLSSLSKSDLENKKVIIRGDLDVSEFSENDIRLQKLVPTVKYLLDNKVNVILIGHMGRPEGKNDDKYSLMPLVPILEKMIGIKENWGLLYSQLTPFK